jgi:hypothetical protein
MSEVNIQFMTDEAFRQCRTSADEVAQNIMPIIQATLRGFRVT